MIEFCAEDTTTNLKNGPSNSCAFSLIYSTIKCNDILFLSEMYDIDFVVIRKNFFR